MKLVEAFQYVKSHGLTNSHSERVAVSHILCGLVNEVPSNYSANANEIALARQLYKEYQEDKNKPLSVGDTAYFIHDGDILSAEITRVVTVQTAEEKQVSYWSEFIFLPVVYKSKEAAIDSLIKEAYALLIM